MIFIQLNHFTSEAQKTNIHIHRHIGYNEDI